MTTRIYFDMDGTLANLYGVENWLEDLRAFNPRPYQKAQPIGDTYEIEKLLLQAINKGYELGVISWLSKESNFEYDMKVRRAKIDWLYFYFPHIKWSDIKIVAYGTPKQNFGKIGDYLIDDEEQNLKAWGQNSVNAKDLVRFLKEI